MFDQLSFINMPVGRNTRHRGVKLDLRREGDAYLDARKRILKFS